MEKYMKKTAATHEIAAAVPDIIIVAIFVFMVDARTRVRYNKLYRTLKTRYRVAI